MCVWGGAYVSVCVFARSEGNVHVHMCMYKCNTEYMYIIMSERINY